MNHRLKEAILRKGMKQKYLAETMKMKPEVFSKKLFGDLPFSRAERVQLAKLPRIKISDIFPKNCDK